jgi:protein O-mannosyl-transferase
MQPRMIQGIIASLKNDTHYWITGAISLAVMVIYLQTGRFAYIGFDDAKYVFANGHVQQGLNPDTIAWAFSTFTLSNWHPVTWLSYMADFSLFGTRPGLYHLENAAFHLANSLLVYAFLVGLTRAPWKSGAVALLFAVHPLHVESVAWISERKDVLSVFWGLLSLLAYTRYVQKSSLPYLVLAWLTFAVSLMAKPMLVTLPCVFLLLDIAPFRRIQLRPASVLKTAILEKIPFFALSGFVSYMAYQAQNASGAMRDFDALPVGIRIANSLDSMVNYLLMTAIPRNLGAFYPHRLDYAPPLETLLNVVVLAVSCWLVWKTGKKRPLVWTGWLWFLGTLVPVLGLIQVGGAAMADRYTYFPHIGLFIAVIWGAAGQLRWGDRKSIWASAVLMTGLAILTVSSVRQTSYWRDTVALFEHTARVVPPNSMVYKLLGVGYGMRGQHDKAREASEWSLELNPYDPEAYGNLGVALLELDQPQEAEYAFRKSIDLKPYDPQLHVYMAIALFRQRKYEDAMLRADEALRIDPEFQRAADLIERCREAMVPLRSLDPE